MLQLSAYWGIVYGGVIYKNQAYFAGYNSERTLHSVQNAIHNKTKDPYFYNYNYQSRTYGYFGRYNSNFLFY